MARPIELYLVRHGIAAERGPRWPDDGQRPLTGKGIARFREVVRGLAALDLAIDVVLTSPLLRAAQTAALLAEGLDPRPEVRITDALVPGATLRALSVAIARAKRRRIACVGHEPGLGQLAAHFVGASRPLEFKKGGVCRIDLDGSEGPGHLAWFAPPRLLRRPR